jgi:hypothetical protein
MRVKVKKTAIFPPGGSAPRTPRPGPLYERTYPSGPEGVLPTRAHVDYCGPNAAFARSSSNLWLQVWESDGDIYWLSWLIICPARRPGELFGGSDELGEAISDH